MHDVHKKAKHTEKRISKIRNLLPCKWKKVTQVLVRCLQLNAEKDVLYKNNVNIYRTLRVNLLNVQPVNEKKETLNSEIKIDVDLLQ